MYQALFLPALIAGGASLASTFLGNKSRQNENQKSRSWSSTMYQRQLEDRRQDRDYDNWYNSPEQQSLRLKAAGINPLAMLKGVSGGVSTGPSTGGTIPQAQFNPNDYSGLAQAGQGFMHGMYDLQLKKEAVRNAQRQNDKLENDNRKAGVEARVSEATEVERILGENARNKIKTYEAAIKQRSAFRDFMINRLIKYPNMKVWAPELVELYSQTTDLTAKQVGVQLKKQQKEINEFILGIKNMDPKSMRSMVPDILKAILINILK